MSKVYFITGTSSGFGAELVKLVIGNGDIAVATSRNPTGLSFEGATEKNFLAVKLDVTSTESVEQAFQEALSKFKKIDVVVNNAGYGLSGVFESVTNEQMQTQFDINFFGLMNVTRKALQVMREQGGGKIQQITSIGGQRGVPTFSTYCASKWAIEGFTEALSHELKPEWKIQLTCVEYGGFRTEWAGGSMVFGDKSLAPAYDHIDAEKNMKARHGTQAGDPVKGAQVLIELANMDEPPLRICVGTDAYAAMQQKVKTYSENIAKYEKLSTGTDVDGYVAPK